MTQRRLDGVTTPPFTGKADEPTCDDCGATSVEVYDRGSRTWPDGRVLRKFSDGNGCYPCSNGEAEVDRWDSPASSPIQEVRDTIRKVRGLNGAPVSKQTPFVAPEVPYVIYDKPCRPSLTGRIQCKVPNLAQVPTADLTDYQKLAADMMRGILSRVPVVTNDV